MNDIENAIESIKKQYIGIDYTNGKDMTVLCIYDKQAEETIRALEKQMPRKVTERKERVYLGDGQRCTDAKCPTCNREIYTFSFKFPTKYCMRCGQKLDWD